MKISNQARTFLAPTRAEVRNGDARIDIRTTLCEWSGPATLVWPVEIVEAGTYVVEIGYSLAIDAAEYQILLDGVPVGQGTLVRTSGFFPDKVPSTNYDLCIHEEPVPLTPGKHELAIRIDVHGDPAPASLSDLRLLPEAARESIKTEQSRAFESRADLSWFSTCGYGLMFHWTSQSWPRIGARKPYPRAVADFDVQKLADLVDATGAAYVMFTANHADPSFPAPLKYWESLYPGWTTERDLVQEMIHALGSRGIKLFLYLNPYAAYIKSGRLRNVDGSRAYSNAIQIHPDCRDDYLDTTCRLLDEIGERYGEGVAGYWFDSWYQPLNQFGTFPMEPVFKSAKAGNPNRLTCFNWWIRPVGTQWQEYWAAEVGGIGVLPAPDERGMSFGAGKGLSGHALLIMDDPWWHTNDNCDISDPRLEKEDLINFIKDCNGKKAPVTVNLGIYQDGGIGSGAAEVMSAVKTALR